MLTNGHAIIKGVALVAAFLVTGCAATVQEGHILWCADQCKNHEAFAEVGRHRLTNDLYCACANGREFDLSSREAKKLDSEPRPE